MSATLKFYFRKYFFLSSLYFKSFVFFSLACSLACSLALPLYLPFSLSPQVVFTCEFEYKINICFHIIANVSGFATCPPGIIEFICKAFYKIFKQTALFIQYLRLCRQKSTYVHPNLEYNVCLRARNIINKVDVRGVLVDLTKRNVLVR